MTNHFALITGASSGIGLDLANVLASQGYNLIIAARRQNILEKTASILTAQFGVKVEPFVCDLSSTDEIEKLLAFIAERNYFVEILVNNAGFGTYGNFYETDWHSEFEMIQVNICALTHLTKKLLPEMIRLNTGRILNVASTAAFQPGPFMAVYYASKAYVLSFSEALSNELTGTKVTVTALCPGPTKTGFQKTAALDSSRLMKIAQVSESYTVAKFGYKKMIQGKRVAIPGFINMVSAHLVSFLPRGLSLKIVRFVQDKLKQPTV